MAKKKEEITKKIIKMIEAFESGYIHSCPKCGSFKITSYVDEDYFSDMLRCSCKECKHSWGDSENDY